jgi:hypothetical protein
MKLGIVGSRNCPLTYEDIYFPILDFYDMIDTNFQLSTDIKKVIVSGGAGGADALAKEFIEKYNMDQKTLALNGNEYKRVFEYIEYLPDWDKFGKSAGPIRNQQIIDDSDALLAFWDGKSPGTRNSIELARKKKIPTLIIYF